MKKKIEKLNINLFPSEFTSEDAYNKKRAEFIADYEIYKPSTSFWGVERDEKDPILGEAEWNKRYPSYNSWKILQRQLNAQGEQNVVDKINEIIDSMK